ncbi:ATP-dependent RNA helicase [Bifidobacterium bombi DSM 19703]|uniref:ATP-dependent RNA helicase n=2 Tax=Bifidobacterium bombi TaxID=471511 RepID=A0A080N2I3_9BIFI|nr:ATP-dependent RNA helicase [Bifidobacterium bombi DSM 19703]
MPNFHSQRQSAAVYSGKNTQQHNNMSEDAAVYAASGDGPERSFSELGVPGPLVSVLASDGKATAFPIQADTLPDSLVGRDILGRGETGSGKTLAFAIPLVARLSGESDALQESSHEGPAYVQKDAVRTSRFTPAPRGMVLAPTRELVNQIDEVIAPLAAAYGMTTCTIYGGVKYSRQIRQLRAGAEIIVACPGRLEDLLNQGELTLGDVEVSVLDEADEMADMGFLPSVTRLLEQVRPEGQRMLFSATLDHGVDKVVKRFLHDAKVHEIAPANAQVDTMTHYIFEVSQGNKYEVIRELASGLGKRILFTRTKYQAKKMADKLVKAGIPAVDLQGNLSQNQRDSHLAAFSEGQVRVMVATDVAARGIDVSDVALVVQTEPPEDPKSFLHRSGRTARAGESGDVVTLVLPNQRRGARQMLQRAGIKVKSQQIVPGSKELDDLVGEHAPLVKDWTLTVPVVNRKAGRSGRSGAGSGRGPRRRTAQGERGHGAERENVGRKDRRRDRDRGEYRSARFDGSDREAGARSNRRAPRSQGGSDKGIRRYVSGEDRPFEGRTDRRRGGDARRDGFDGIRDGNPRYAESEGRRNANGVRRSSKSVKAGRGVQRSYDQSKSGRAAGGFNHGKNKKRNAVPFRRNGK